LPPVSEALQALRGVQFTVAVTTVAARGDLTRFNHPRELRQFLGLMPSEYSTGERRRQGAITKAGNTHARRALVEGAWAYRYPAKGSRHLHRRLEPHPKAIQDLRWKAQLRLCKRYHRLIARGTHANQGVVAIARELIGCLWAIPKQLPVAPEVQRPEGGSTPNAERCQRAAAETPPRLWCNPRRRSKTPRASSGRACGRHPPETRQVVTNPRRSAGSPGAFYWLRLCRCPREKTTMKTDKRESSTLDLGSHLNARHEPLPEAGAERTL
jgi:Transposase IS116/IS110/IS902 family